MLYIVLFRYGLWINLWIKGVKSVDKPVENFVDNSGLWISREDPHSSTGNAIIHNFGPQLDGLVLGLGKGNTEFVHTIHRPYYYYYSKNLKV